MDRAGRTLARSRHVGTRLSTRLSKLARLDRLLASALALAAAGCGAERAPMPAVGAAAVLGPRAALRVERELPDDVRQGEEVSFLLRVRNVSRETVEGVRLRARAPEGLDVHAARVSIEGSPFAERPLAAGVREHLFELGTLAPLGSAAVRFTGVARRQGIGEGTIWVGHDASVATPWDVAAPALRVHLRVPPAGAWTCEPIEVRVAVENQGERTHPGGELDLRLSDGLEPLEGALRFGPLEPGERVEGSRRLLAARGGDYVVEAEARTRVRSVRSPAREVRVREAQLALFVEPVGPLAQGDVRRVAVVLANVGADPAQDVELALEGLRGVAAGLCGRGDATGGATLLEVGGLAVGEERHLMLELRAPGGEGSPATWQARLVARARCVDGRDALVEELGGPVSDVPAATLSLLHEAYPFGVGEGTAYHVTLDYERRRPGSSLEVALALPDGLELSAAEGSTPVASRDGAIRFVALEGLEPGETAEWTLRVRALDPVWPAALPVAEPAAEAPSEAPALLPEPDGVAQAPRPEVDTK